MGVVKLIMTRVQPPLWVNQDAFEGVGGGLEVHVWAPTTLGPWACLDYNKLCIFIFIHAPPPQYPHTIIVINFLVYRFHKVLLEPNWTLHYESKLISMSKITEHSVAPADYNFTLIPVHLCLVATG